MSVNKIYPNKMHSLHNCPLRFSIFHSTEPYVIPKRKPNGKFSYSGREISIINTLSTAMNFKVNFSYIGNNIYSCTNVSVKGPLKSVLIGEADVTISNWLLSLLCLQYFDSTVSYISEQIVFMVPEGRDWTSFEKLIYPFTLWTWLLVLTCILIGYIVIWIIKRRSIAVQDFVFGVGVSNPHLNMFIALVGGTQHYLPTRNFARFLLMMFLIYSLIIRTLYQGSYYEQSNKHHMEAETIAEMYDDDFKFYTIHGYADMFKEAEATKNKLRLLSVSHQIFCIDLILGSLQCHQPNEKSS